MSDFETVRGFLGDEQVDDEFPFGAKKAREALDRIEAEVERLRAQVKRSNAALDEVGNPIRLGGEEA